MELNQGVPDCYRSTLSAEEYSRLNDSAYEIRRLVTRMISMCNWGHIGGSYSLAEILSVLYGRAAKVSHALLEDTGRDYIVLSKAHTSPALYAALCTFGLLPEQALYGYGMVEGLDGHLAKGHPKGVECSGGSLGLGLSYCVGLAAALKLKQKYAQRVYCICGDGELNEGQMWEAMQSASQYHLDNLILVVDYNKVMAKGFTYEGMGIAPLAEKISAFGFTVQECDGHDVETLWEAMYHARYRNVCGKPSCILAHTVKGRGVERCEFNYRWHTHAPNVETANAFLQELAQKWSKEYYPIESAVKGADPGLQGVVGEGL